MSAYSATQTQMTEAGLLVEALKEMGYNPVVCLDNPQALKGYMGDYRTADGSGHTTDVRQAMKAHVIIPQGQLKGAANDIGFVLGADGKFSGIYSQYDRRANATAEWQQRLSGEYGCQKAQKEMRKAGFRMTQKTVNKGKVEFAFVKA